MKLHHFRADMYAASLPVFEILDAVAEKPPEWTGGGKEETVFRGNRVGYFNLTKKRSNSTMSFLLC